MLDYAVQCEKSCSRCPVNHEVDSAGLAPDADTRLSSEQVDWAEIIFVMEKRHHSVITHRFREHLKGKRVIYLDIPDNYGFMDPELVKVLKNTVPRHLPQLAAAPGEQRGCGNMCTSKKRNVPNPSLERP